MRKTTKRLLCMCMSLLAAVTMAAQTGFGAYKSITENKEETTQRWALSAHIGGNSISNASHSGDEVPLYQSGAASQTGLLTKLHVEYYLPNTPFSVKAGYEREECNLLKGDASADLDQLLLGGRWYPAPRYWCVQPYAGADMLWAFGAERGRFDMSANLNSSYEYHATGTVNMPRFSVAPVIGADIYLFSCLALQLEYGYRFGIDSRYNVTYTEPQRGHEAKYHGQTHRHVFSVGLKVTFPFSFTSRDMQGLLDGILNSLLLVD